MNHFLGLEKNCPQCSSPVEGWLGRLFNAYGLSIKDRSRRATTGSTPDATFTSAPFACRTCGRRLGLKFTDSHFLPKLAGAVVAGFVAGFIFPAFIGLAACFICGVFFASLFVALLAAWLFARAVSVDATSSASAFLNDDAR